MAEIQDTSGAKPQLRRYQSKGLRIQDAPTGRKGGVVEEADEKMWDSILNDIGRVVDVNVKMNAAALDLEKQNMNAEMQSHYLDNKVKIENNINAFRDGQLSADAFDHSYGTDEGIKIEGQAGVKSFVMSNKYSKKAQEQMAPMLELSDKRFKSNVKRMYYEELIKRNEDFLNHNETKTLSLLRKQLAEPEGELRDAIIQAKEQGGTEMFINSGRVEQHKQSLANNSFRLYADVIQGKVEKKLMTQERADLRLELYGQALGDIYFDHYVALDPDKAYKLALEDGIKVEGDGKEVIYNSEKISNFILRQRLKSNSELELGKRNAFISQALLDIKGGNASAALEGILHAYNPNSRTGKYSGAMARIDHFPQYVRHVVSSGKEAAPRKYTTKEKDRLAQIYFEEGGLKNKGFNNWYEVKDMLLKLTNKALDEKKADKALEKRLDRERDDKFNYAFFGGISKITANKDIQKRNLQLAEFYNANLETNTWDAKPGTLKTLLEAGIERSEAETKLILAVKGIDPRSVGSGLKAGMPTLQTAIDNYWRLRLLTDPDSNSNTDPMNMPEYKSYLLNENENKIITSQIKGYKDIEHFNQKQIKTLPSKELAKEWKNLQARHTTATSSGSGQKSRALAMLEREFGQIVNNRVTAMQTDPIKLAMSDMNIEFDFLAKHEDRVPLPNSFKEGIDKWYAEIGEPRAPIAYTGPGGMEPVYNYLPEEFILLWNKKLENPATLEGVSKAKKKGEREI